MKTASTDFKNMLAAADEFVAADLYHIVLADGTEFRWTTAQSKLEVGGDTYVVGPPIARERVSWKLGTGVDDLKMTISDDGSVTVGSYSIMQAAQRGAFDRATVTLKRFVSTSWTDMSNGAVDVFTGTVGLIEAAAGVLKLTIESPMAELKAMFPRMYYLPSCSNTLYDSICGLNPALFTESLTVEASPTPTATKFGTGSGNADGYYTLGKITFTSGALAGMSRAIKTYASGVVTVVYPFPSIPEVGDGFDIVAGCSKTRSVCENRFNNLARFRGFPYIPDPATQYAGNGVTAPATGGASPGGGGSTRGSNLNTNLH